MPSTIVVGIDGSPASRAAADWAARRAQRYGSEMRLVLTVPDIWDPHEACPTTDGIEPAVRALDAEKDRLASIFPGAIIHTAVRRGEPAMVLGELSHDAGMVVVGSDKPADAHGEGFGAVGLQLVTRSDCTVAIIPNDDPRGAGVVAGIDGSPEAERALRVAAGEAEMSGQALTVVHAVGDAVSGRPGQSRSPSVQPGAAEAGTRLLDAAVATARARHPHLEIHRILDTRHGPAEALANAAAGAGLVVVGSRGRESIMHVRPGAMGSVIQARIPCPLLVTSGPVGKFLVGTK